MLVTLRDQQVKCISIRAVFYHRSNILNAWMMEERKKQTNRQTKFSWIFLEEARWFFRAISFVPNEHHGFGAEMWNIMKENDGWYLSSTCWTPLDATFSVCLADFFNLLGTASSSSVETTSKYNSSAVIFKPIQGRVV